VSTTPRCTRVKICGITRPIDAEAVAQAGADALGLVFTARSARQVAVAQAVEIAVAVAGRVLRVGVFLDPGRAEVEGVLERVPLDVLQFQGDESAGFCTGFGLPYMKVHRIRDSVDEDAMAATHPDACCHLLDTFVAGQPGGTGKTFDWTLVPSPASLRYVLAGGLTPDNVGEAMRRGRPFGVDVSGGVEAGTKGVKDANAIRRFVTAVRQTDRQRSNVEGQR
jgi:phosphoribosylanthranilate isomerase